MEEENRIITFISKYWSKILLAVLTVACVGAWGERFLKKNHRQSSQDYIVVKQIYDHFRRGDQLAEELIESTENIIKRHKELIPKYEAMLAVTHLAQGPATKAVHYTESLINKSARHLPPYYQSYAQTTLLITQERFQAAYDNALSLHGDLKNQSDYQIVDVLNTVRLFFLAGRLGKTQEQLAFWQEIHAHPAYSSIEPFFTAGTISLKDYADKLRA